MSKKALKWALPILPRLGRSRARPRPTNHLSDTENIMATEDTDVTSLLKLIRKDPVVKKALEITDNVGALTNLIKIENEAKLLHQERTSRELYKQRPSAVDVYQASLQDLAARARVSELKANLYVNARALEIAYDQAAAHTATRFADMIREYATNKADRTAIVDTALKKIVKLREQLRSTDSLLDLYIKDIDSAGYALRNATELIKQIADHKNG